MARAIKSSLKKVKTGKKQTFIEILRDFILPFVKRKTQKPFLVKEKPEE